MADSNDQNKLTTVADYFRRREENGKPSPSATPTPEPEEDRPSHDAPAAQKALSDYFKGR